jgi:hypothetical protein
MFDRENISISDRLLTYLGSLDVVTVTINAYMPKEPMKVQPCFCRGHFSHRNLIYIECSLGVSSHYGC